MATTIRVDESVRDKLRRMKMHSRETYNEVLVRILEDLQELNEETEREIRKALEEIETGRFKTHDDVKRDFGF